MVGSLADNVRMAGGFRMKGVVLAALVALVFLAGRASVGKESEGLSTAFVRASSQAQGAVAHLIVTRLVRAQDPFEGFFDDVFARRFYRRGAPAVGRETSMGSGVIVDA